MSRERIYQLLRERPESFFSGQELSRRLGLSRAAVWKTVDALRREGYEIEARTGLGYRLAAAPDALTEAEIEQRVAQRLWQARKYEKQTYRNADELNLANLAFEYCGENLAVNFAYDERRSGSPRRRGSNRDYHNQQSLWHGRDCLNEEAFLLEPGQYGRIIWNERCADCDTGHWYYQLHIYNILLFKRGVPPADILLTRQPDYEYSQLADLY